MTVVLQDFTSAKRSEKVKLPLNGVNYWCVPEVAADFVVEVSNTSAGNLRNSELPAGFTMDDLATLTPEKRAQLEEAGAGFLAEVMIFLGDVMEPDSWETFREHMRPIPKEGLNPATRRRLQDRLITFGQLVLVFKALMQHYMGRPTVPSDSSGNGSGGTGGTSTDGAPPEA